MNWIVKMFGSSLGQKLIMALTGLFLCSFLVIHMIGNLQLFKNDMGLAFNKYAVFMTTNPLIKTVSYLLYAAILFHAFKGLWLAYKNQKARPVKYQAFDGKANSHWSSRNMGVLGTIVLVFIVIHMSNFWFQYKFGHVPYTRYTENIQTGELFADNLPKDFTMHSKMEEVMEGTMKVTIVKDLYREVAFEFKTEWWLVALYVLSMGAIAFHLYHGFKSAFQTLGLNHKKYNGLIEAVSTWVFAIILPLGFAAMPIYFFVK
ncbi:MAG: succinate dehydrogenase cytochrome b subunit [Bacteroidota bacterium]